jgi:hypothetical protein
MGEEKAFLELLAYSYGRFVGCKNFNRLHTFVHAFSHVLPKHNASVPSAVLTEWTFEYCLFQTYHLIQNE